eukprot:TRINITY_DN25025_c0_g1_i2.p1 TRINITY_DN25025_c0_g1~~TRINITY_DN25025_c0_g1_i2.p1  ORF type:complete len:133 (-),score=9.99 TRINITY_DN25025_c0_g1_i2:255-653(-)
MPPSSVIIFMSSCKHIESLDLSLFNHLTDVGEGCMDQCTSLKFVLLPLTNSITIIHRAFLADCTSITSIDLLPLRNVTYIEDSFMIGCRGLTSLDLTPLSENVTTIEDGCFVGACSSLTLRTVLVKCCKKHL